MGYMGEKLDFKKEYKGLYLPGKKPALVTVPPMRFLAADGTGAPEDPPYQETLQMLYTVTFTIKMSKLSGDMPAGYVDYVLPPLEGLWDAVPGELPADRHAWRWTSLLRVPEYVTEEVLAWAVEKAKGKHPALPWERLRLETLDEGLCVQAMHQGPYASEPETLARMHAFLDEQVLSDGCGTPGPQGIRRHHELYLSDPRRTAPEKLRTVLRHPVVAL